MDDAGAEAEEAREERAVRTGLALVLTIGLLAIDNVLTNRVLPSAWYFPTRLVTVALLVLVSMRVGGADADDLGIDPDRIREGLRWGVAAATPILLVMALAAAIPATRDFYRDERAGGIGLVGLLYQVGLRIPLGTVVPEELFFRGVMVGLGRKLWGTVAAVALSSVLFGLWHVLPAQTVSSANEGLAATGVGGAVVPSAVLATAAAGAVFASLRLRSGSVVAPMVVHLTTNAAGFVLAWLVLR